MSTLLNLKSVCKKSAGLIKLLSPLLLLFSLILSAQAQTVSKEPVKYTLSVFTQLGKLPANQRAAKAGQAFKMNCHDIGEKPAMAILDSLEWIAKQLNDQPLECSVFNLRADYYSVNRGYNQVSVDYYQHAIDFAVAHNMPDETAICLHKKGLYFFTFNHNTEACQYFLRAYDQFKKIGLNLIPDISTYILEQAKFYYTLKDYNSAKPLLETALRYPIGNTRVGLSVINTIGLIYRSSHQYPEALNYFNQTLKAAAAKKDSAWMGIALGNIGSVYFLQGLYDKAMPYLMRDYQASLKYAQASNAAQTLLRISQVTLVHKQYKVAAMQLDSAALLITQAKEEVLPLWIELYKQRAALYENTGKLDSALRYTKKYGAAKDALAQRDNIAMLEGVKLKWETENYRHQIKGLKSTVEVETFKRNALVVIFILLLVVFILIFNRFRLDAKRDRELLLIRKKRVDERLKTASEALEQYTEHLRQNNIIIEKSKAEIARVKTHSANQADIVHLEQLMQAHIMTDESWDEFKKLFTKAHSGFFLKLRSNFPNLTDTDMRLLALIKLGLNTREMANMLGITIEGIKKSKQRLRKKMLLTSEIAIEETIANM
jgi:tetratricopeptide (TPR) repeat protein